MSDTKFYSWKDFPVIDPQRKTEAERIEFVKALTNFMAQFDKGPTPKTCSRNGCGVRFNHRGAYCSKACHEKSKKRGT
jgi:hypothetical protein